MILMLSEFISCPKKWTKIISLSLLDDALALPCSNQRYQAEISVPGAISPLRREREGGGAKRIKVAAMMQPCQGYDRQFVQGCPIIICHKVCIRIF